MYLVTFHYRFSCQIVKPVPESAARCHYVSMIASWCVPVCPCGLLAPDVQWQREQTPYGHTRKSHAVDCCTEEEADLLHLCLLVAPSVPACKQAQTCRPLHQSLTAHPPTWTRVSWLREKMIQTTVNVHSWTSSMRGHPSNVCQLKCPLAVSTLSGIMGPLNQCEEQMAVLCNIIASKAELRRGGAEISQATQGHHSLCGSTQTLSMLTDIYLIHTLMRIFIDNPAWKIKICCLGSSIKVFIHT